MRELKPQHKEFADNYISNGNGTQAIKDVFPTITNDNSAAVKASVLLRNSKVREYIDSKAEVVAKVIYSLATESENETIQLNASKDILDRAGYKPVEKSINLNLNSPIDEETINKAHLFDEWYKRQQSK